MNKTTEALKLAEEALHNTGNALICLTTTRKLRPMYQEMRDDAVEGCNKALAAIREALAEPVKQEPVAFEEALEALYWEFDARVKGYGKWKLNRQSERDAFKQSVRSICAAPVQPVKQEPVAYVTGYYGGRCVVEPLNRASVLPNNLALYAAPVDAKAIREQALEEAAKVQEQRSIERHGYDKHEDAAVIRGLK